MSDEQGFSTRAIHAGQEADPRTGAVVPAIYQVSTYKQDGVGGTRGGYEYSRSGNPTRTVLEETLASLEGGRHGLAFASGLAAEDAVLRAFTGPDGHCVVPHDAYGGTFRLIDKVFTMASDRGLRVLPTLWLTPDWANGGRGSKVLPNDLNDYARVAQFAANRWRGIEAWQVWNEPNLDAFLNPPDPTAYTRLLQAAYPAIKRGNPAARVVRATTPSRLS